MYICSVCTLYSTLETFATLILKESVEINFFYVRFDRSTLKFINIWLNIGKYALCILTFENIFIFFIFLRINECII